MYGWGGCSVLPLFLILRSNRCEVDVITLVTRSIPAGIFEIYSQLTGTGTYCKFFVLFSAITDLKCRIFSISLHNGYYAKVRSFLYRI